MMNNEPVGYFLYNEEYEEWEETHAGTTNSVPLYAHPVKELTDEEKLIFGMLFMNWNRSLKEPLIKPAYEQYVFEQAIAILRKAQEK